MAIVISFKLSKIVGVREAKNRKKILRARNERKENIRKLFMVTSSHFHRTKKKTYLSI